MDEKINLIWHTFGTHGQDMLKNLMITEEFSDITLVSDDQHKFRVHRFILSACSTVLRNMMKQNPHITTFNLQGIQHQELVSILKFIYLGKTTFYSEQMNAFLNAAKNLDIKEISKDVVEDNHEKYEENEEVQNRDNFDVEDQNNEDILNEEDRDKDNFIEEEMISDQYSGKDYPCNQCDHKASTAPNLQVHSWSVHGIMVYPCPKCDYKATQSGNLKRHIRFKHDEQKNGFLVKYRHRSFNSAKKDNIKELSKEKYNENEDFEENLNKEEDLNLNEEEDQSKDNLNEKEDQNKDNLNGEEDKNNQDLSGEDIMIDGFKHAKCPYCDYHKRFQCQIKRHIEAKHSGKKYPCNRCYYKATTEINLKQHIRSVHEGKKYPCPKCDYKATQAANLNKHIKVQHDVIKYSCKQCDFQANYEPTLVKHIKNIHMDIMQGINLI